MTLPLNDHHVCIVCRSRADAVAVGYPNNLGWFCHTCGPDRAWEVFKLKPKALDQFERIAIQRVIDRLADGPLTVPKEDLPEFLTWLIQEFGIAIREEIDSGRAPF